MQMQKLSGSYSDGDNMLLLPGYKKWPMEQDIELLDLTHSYPPKKKMVAELALQGSEERRAPVINGTRRVIHMDKNDFFISYQT